MICRDCAHPFIAGSQNDRDMAKLGYRSCGVARTPTERAKYISGTAICQWPSRAEKQAAQ